MEFSRIELLELELVTRTAPMNLQPVCDYILIFMLDLWEQTLTSLVCTQRHPLCVSGSLLCLVSQRRAAVPFPLLFFSVCTLQAGDGE